MILAHIGGLPVEETILQLAPAAGVFALAATAKLREVNEWRRRRRRHGDRTRHGRSRRSTDPT